MTRRRGRFGGGMSAAMFAASFSSGARLDARDVGVRPEAASALGFADTEQPKAPSSHDTDACDVFGCPDCLLDQGVV